MNPKVISGWIMLICIAAWLLWNFSATVNDNPDDKFSDLVAKVFAKHPSVVAVTFFAAGHLFWSE